MWQYPIVVFIESRVFTRLLHDLAKWRAPEVLSAIQSDLLRNPEAGRMVQGLGGIRKARAADPGRGKGKRGGFRYLYLDVPARAHIHLLYLFGKDEQEDLDLADRTVLRKLAEQIRNQK
jgi:hypothetical protein